MNKFHLCTAISFNFNNNRVEDHIYKSKFNQYQLQISRDKIKPANFKKKILREIKNLFMDKLKSTKKSITLLSKI